MACEIHGQIEDHIREGKEFRDKVIENKADVKNLTGWISNMDTKVIRVEGKIDGMLMKVALAVAGINFLGIAVSIGSAVMIVKGGK